MNKTQMTREGQDEVESGTRKAVSAQTQHREAMDTKPAKRSEMSQPESPGLSRVSLGRWQTKVRWPRAKVHKGAVLERYDTDPPLQNSPFPPAPGSLPGILNLGNALQRSVELRPLNLHGCMCQHGFLDL